MANKTIIIASIKDGDKWVNVFDNNKVEYGINKEKSPKLTEILKTAKEGEEITGSHSVGKDGKNFLWDPNEAGKGGSGKSFTPADKSFDAGKVAAQAAGSMLALTKDASTTQFDILFDHIHAKIMSKVTKSQTTETK